MTPWIKLGLSACMALALAACVSVQVSDNVVAPSPPPAPPTAAPAPQPPPQPVNYGDTATWLCRPGAKDACAIPQDATAIRATGQLKVIAYRPAPAPKIDCFYVYPTISRDPGGNSTMEIAAEDRVVVRNQAARLGAVCRVFAPKYRQVTLAALRARLAGKPIPADRDLAYGDVVAAWRHYLAHDNQGRGVVLVGHSQGSGILRRLIAEEIDGKADQKRLVAAYLLGTNLPVPLGQDVGGAFKYVPLCRSATQTGCVVAFASFRADVPPPANSLFGKVDEPGQAAACVNPAAPAGGMGVLKPYYVASNEAIVASLNRKPWLNPPEAITTPFVTLPGLIQARCVATAAGSYLEVSIIGAKGDKRAPHIPGDLVIGGQRQDAWGLHLVDVNLVMGNMLDLIASQTKAYQGQR